MALSKEEIGWVGIKLAGLYLLVLAIFNVVTLISSCMLYAHDSLVSGPQGLFEISWHACGQRDDTFISMWYSAFRLVIFGAFGWYFLAKGRYALLKAFPDASIGEQSGPAETEDPSDA